MALYWYDSFQDYTSLLTVFDAQSGGNASISSSGGRSASQCFFSNGNGGNNWKRLAPLSTSGGTNHVDSTIGVAVKFTALPGVITPVLGFGDYTGSDNIQVDVRYKTDGSFQVTRNGTVLGTSSSPVITDTNWHYLEFYALIDPSAGGFTVKVDGTIVAGLNLTSQNTRATSNSYLNEFYLAGAALGASMQFNISDLYLLDSSGSSPLNTFLGDVQVLHSLATSNAGTNNFTPQAASWAASTAMALGAVIIDTNGNLQKVTANTGDTHTGGSPPTWATSLNATTTDNHVTWTCLTTPANYEYINSVPFADSQAYLSDATINDIELYNFGAITAPTGVGAALAVGVDIRGQRDATTTRGVRGYTSSNSVTGDNGSDLVLANGTWLSKKAIIPNDPNTGAAWTIAALNAANFGVKVTF